MAAFDCGTFILIATSLAGGYVPGSQAVANRDDAGKSNSGVRNPWEGFGLGSTVVRRQTFKVENKVRMDMRTAYRITMRGRRGPRFERQETDLISGQVRRSDDYDVTGSTPSGIGLKLESKRDDEIEINGASYPVSVERWMLSAEQRAVKSRRQPDASAPPQQRPGKAVKVKDEVKVELYLARQEINVPYRALPGKGHHIALGPRTLKAVYTATTTVGDAKSISKFTYSETVTHLTDTVRVGDRDIPCVRISAEFDDPGRKTRGRGTIWLSNEVPGRRVKMLRRGTIPGDGAAEVQEVVEAFDSKPLGDVALGDLPPLDARPKIPDRDWAGLHLGAWRVGFFSVYDREKRITQVQELSLSQVVRIDDDGHYVRATRELGPEGPKDEATYHLEMANSGPGVPAETKKETIKLHGIPALCERRTYRRRQGSLQTITTQWNPQAQIWKDFLAGQPIKYVRQEEVEEGTRLDGKKIHHRKVTEIVGTGVAVKLGRNQLPCSYYKTSEWEDGERTWTIHAFRHDRLPGVAEVRRMGKEHIYSLTLDFGEAELSPPTGRTVKLGLISTIGELQRLTNRTTTQK